MQEMMKLFNRRNSNVALHCIPGHFATSHSHINYYIDLTSVKTRANEAHEAARLLVSDYARNGTVVDTIVCLDGTEVIGAFMAEEFLDKGFYNTNRHKTIYIDTPEYNNNNQLFFRENIAPSIRDKHVILLLASTTTGLSVKRAVECIQYYGGHLTGVSSLFSTIRSVEGIGINYIFDTNDLPGYMAYKPRECPFCQKGIKIDAMVNGFGFSRF